MKLMLSNVRLAFPQLFTAQRVNGEGEPAFSASLLLAPTHPAVAVLEKAFEEVAKEKWGAKAAAVLKAMKATDKVCLHDGDTKSNYDGFPGNMFVSARSKVRPTVIDRDRTQLSQEDGKPYSGCYVNASIELWAQDNKFGKRINAQLRGVQFFADGDAFAGGSTPAEAEEFGDLSTADAEVDPTA
jgi:hypothetical protein